MNFLQKFRDFVAQPTHKRTLSLLVMLFLVAGISLTVFVAQQQQTLKQRAYVACTDDSDCATGEICNVNGQCQPALANGDTCTANGGSCVTGSCVSPATENTNYSCGSNPNGSTCCTTPVDNCTPIGGACVDSGLCPSYDRHSEYSCGSAPVGSVCCITQYSDTCTPAGGSCVDFGLCPSADRHTEYICGSAPAGSVCCIAGLPTSTPVPTSIPTVTVTPTPAGTCSISTTYYSQTCTDSTGLHSSLPVCTAADPGEYSFSFDEYICNASDLCEVKHNDCAMGQICNQAGPGRSCITECTFNGQATCRGLNGEFPASCSVDGKFTEYQCDLSQNCTNPITHDCANHICSINSDGVTCGSITPTPPTGSPTITTTPTVTLTPTAAPTSVAGATIIQLPANAFTFLFTGSKDSTVMTTHDQSLTINLYSSSDDPSSDPLGNSAAYKTTGTLAASGTLSFDLGKVTAGTYKMLLKSPKYLRALENTRTVLDAGGTITLALNKRLADGAGDTNDDNVLDIQDYSAIIGCFGDKANTSSCTNKNGADLNDDGVIDGIDYNIFLTSLTFTHRNGD